MSPALITAISRHQPLWAVSSLGCHQPWLLTPSRHQPLWAVSSLGCHQTWLTAISRHPTLVGCQFPGIPGNSPKRVDVLGITYSKSTPTLVGSKFPGMSPALITYSKSTLNPCGLSVPWDVTSLDYLLQVDTNPCGLSVPWDVTRHWCRLTASNPSRHQPLWAVSSLGCHQTWLLTPSRHQPLWAVSSLGCHQPWITYSKSTPTLVGCQFPGMSPDLITYSKSTPTLVGCQFPGMSPALITYSKYRHQPLWAVSSLGCHQTFEGCTYLVYHSRHQALWAVSSLGCHQPWLLTPSRHNPCGLSVPWDVTRLDYLHKSTPTLVGCQFPGMSPDLIYSISRHQPLWAVSSLGCHQPWLTPSRHQPLWAVSSLGCHQTWLLTSKSTPTLVGCQFPGMSPALITYSKSTPTLVGCQFPGMSPDLITAISRHQPLWAVSSLGCHQPWLLTPCRHQPLWAVSSLGCHQTWLTAISRHQPLWAVSSLMSPDLITYSKSTPTLVGCQFPGMSPALSPVSRHPTLVSAVSSLGCHHKGWCRLDYWHPKSTPTLVGCPSSLGSQGTDTSLDYLLQVDKGWCRQQVWCGLTAHKGWCRLGVSNQVPVPWDIPENWHPQGLMSTYWHTSHRHQPLWAVIPGNWPTRVGVPVIKSGDIPVNWEPTRVGVDLE